MNILKNTNFLFQKMKFLISLGGVFVIPISFAQSASEVFDCKSLWDKTSYNEEAYTRGLNPSLTLKNLVRKLKVPGVSATTTHIEELRPLGLKHIHFIKEGISLKPEDNHSHIRLKILNNMKDELDYKYLQKELTYEWWLFFNWKLAIVSYNKPNGNTQNVVVSEIFDVNKKSNSLLLKHNYHITGRYIQAALEEDFPFFIVLPVTGPSGILAINKTMVNHIHYAGLMHGRAYADGVFVQPDKYFEHDLIHHNAITFLAETEKEQQFYTQLLDQIQTLKGHKRTMAELEFFLFRHEEYPPPHGRQTILDTLVKRFKDINDLGMFFPQNLPRSEKNIKHFLTHTGQIFNQAIEALPKHNVPEYFLP